MENEHSTAPPDAIDVANEFVANPDGAPIELDDDENTTPIVKHFKVPSDEDRQTCAKAINTALNALFGQPPEATEVVGGEDTNIIGWALCAQYFNTPVHEHEDGEVCYAETEFMLSDLPGPFAVIRAFAQSAKDLVNDFGNPAQQDPEALRDALAAKLSEAGLDPNAVKLVGDGHALAISLSPEDAAKAKANEIVAEFVKANIPGAETLQLDTRVNDDAAPGFYL